MSIRPVALLEGPSIQHLVEERPGWATGRLLCTGQLVPWKTYPHPEHFGRCLRCVARLADRAYEHKL